MFSVHDSNISYIAPRTAPLPANRLNPLPIGLCAARTVKALWKSSNPASCITFRKLPASFNSKNRIVRILYFLTYLTTCPSCARPVLRGKIIQQNVLIVNFLWIKPMLRSSPWPALSMREATISWRELRNGRRTLRADEAFLGIVPANRFAKRTIMLLPLPLHQRK